jgi:hypothetical protein
MTVVFNTLLTSNNQPLAVTHHRPRLRSPNRITGALPTPFASTPSVASFAPRCAIQVT